MALHILFVYIIWIFEHSKFLKSVTFQMYDLYIISGLLEQSSLSLLWVEHQTHVNGSLELTIHSVVTSEFGVKHKIMESV